MRDLLRPLLLCLLVALFVLYPAWLSPGHVVIGDWLHPDMISNHWLYRWIPEQLMGGGDILHNDRYYVPIGDGPWLAGNGSDALPYTLIAALIPWPGSVTLWAILALVLNGMSGYALARAAGARVEGATAAAVALTSLPYVAYEMAGGRFAQMPLYWMGFFLATWLRLLEQPTARRGLLAGVLYAATAITYWYYGLWAAIAGFILFVARPNLRALLVFVPVALACTAPLLWVFLTSWQAIPGTANEVFPHPLAMQSALPFSFPFFGGVYADVTLPLVLVVLPALGWSSAPRHWRWGLGAAALLFYLLALGPYLVLPNGTRTEVPSLYSLFYRFGGVMQRFWWPYRHIAPLAVVLAPLAAWGWDRRIGGQRAPLLLLPLLGLIETWVRNGQVATTCSWWEEPAAYAALAHVPGEGLLELPLAPTLTFSQQRLSYQWVHHKRLVNGHAPWVERVRPDAWDGWVQANGLLRGLWAWEKGEATEPLVVTAEDLRHARLAGLDLITLNEEYFPGDLDALYGRYQDVLTDLFGPPRSLSKTVMVWSLSNWTGQSPITLPYWMPPQRYLSSDTVTVPGLTAVNADGWQVLSRSFPQRWPSDSSAVPADLPQMLERKLKRER